MRSEPIIYFTKEDGQNKILFTNKDDINWRGAISKPALEEASKKIGHKPTNVYMLTQGHEIKLM